MWKDPLLWCKFFGWYWLWSPNSSSKLRSGPSVLIPWGKTLLNIYWCRQSCRSLLWITAVYSQSGVASGARPVWVLAHEPRARVWEWESAFVCFRCRRCVGEDVLVLIGLSFLLLIYSASLEAAAENSLTVGYHLFLQFRESAPSEQDDVTQLGPVPRRQRWNLNKMYEFFSWGLTAHAA